MREGSMLRLVESGVMQANCNDTTSRVAKPGRNAVLVFIVILASG
jgi:hypothetical protein